MPMIPPGFPRLLQRGSLVCREQPGPDTRLCRMRRGVLSRVHQHHSRIVPFQVSLGQVVQRGTWRSECRENRCRKRHRAVLLSCAVMHGQPPRMTIQPMHPTLPTFRQPPPAAIPPVYHQSIWRRHMRKHRGHLGTRSHHRHVGCSCRADHPFDRPTCLVQHMSLTTDQRMPCLVLGGSRHLCGHRQTRQELLDVSRRAPCRSLASGTCVNVPHPRRLGW